MISKYFSKIDNGKLSKDLRYIDKLIGRFTESNHVYEINNFDYKRFIKDLRFVINSLATKNQPIVFVCVGTDKVCGDSYAPLIGTSLNLLNKKVKNNKWLNLTNKLLKHNENNKNNNNRFYIYGFENNLVHAQTLDETLETIKTTHKNPFIIAIDAGLCTKEQFDGCVHMSLKPLKAGSGVGKDLTPFGDVSIVGFTTMSSGNDYINNKLMLTTVSIHKVLKMSRFTYKAIKKAMFSY